MRAPIDVTLSQRWKTHGNPRENDNLVMGLVEVSEDVCVCVLVAVDSHCCTLGEGPHSGHALRETRGSNPRSPLFYVVSERREQLARGAYLRGKGYEETKMTLEGVRHAEKKTNSLDSRERQRYNDAPWLMLRWLPRVYDPRVF